MLRRKVIFHIDEMNKWGMVLKNVENLLNAVNEKDINIEVLANGEAVKYYKKRFEIGYEDIKNLHCKDVKFMACNNSLIGNGLEKNQLIDFIEVVPVGVLELIDKQHEGYAYIKP